MGLIVVSVALHVVTVVCEQLPLLRFLAAMPCAAFGCLEQPSFGVTAALECVLVLLQLQRGPVHEQPDPDGLWIAPNQPLRRDSALQQA